jgi:hypothetical protein
VQVNPDKLNEPVFEGAVPVSVNVTVPDCPAAIVPDTVKLGFTMATGYTMLLRLNPAIVTLF